MRPRLSLEEKMQLAFREWKEALKGLSAPDFERIVYPEWNLKDVLGHVLAYLALNLRHVQTYKKRRRLASPRAVSYAYFNRREAERLRSVPLAQLRVGLNSTFHELCALVPTLTAKDLSRQFPAQWTNSTYKTTLRYQLRSTADHMQMHAKQVKAWRENVGK